ncbi:hypothetical protein Cgig2_013758 [Carnegiea gigantea]|uniref:RRM domain-containing protein n=1 Tax=Carnegiea gigantea TaxID=171969 RepID=A0A9Q1K8N1_9CARY|nr:hypothetical protein Cgig2_013758 [Carnegiea gigantea]
MSISLRKGNTRLPPEVNRVLYVRNLPFNITSEEMYDIFGKYGAIRQIRIGTNKDTRGTAFVVYEDIYDAKTAVDHLSGFNVANRYLIVLYYQPAKMNKKIDQKKKEEEITKLQEKYGLHIQNMVTLSSFVRSGARHMLTSHSFYDQLGKVMIDLREQEGNLGNGEE